MVGLHSLIAFVSLCSFSGVRAFDVTCSLSETAPILGCLQTFLDAHSAQIAAIANTNNCELQNLNCTVFSSTVGCINGVVLSAACRTSIEIAVNQVIATQSITCVVADMMTLCPNSIALVTDSGEGTILKNLSLIGACLLLTVINTI